MRRILLLEGWLALGMVAGCGDNANDVGLFDNHGSGGTAGASTAAATGGRVTSSAAPSSSTTTAAGNGTNMGGTGGTLGGADASGGSQATSSGGEATATSGAETATGGSGGSGGAGASTTGGGTGGESSSGGGTSGSGGGSSCPDRELTCADFGPGAYPENEQDCSCAEGLSCIFLECDGRGRIRAGCGGGRWEVEASPCESRPCAANPEGDEVLRCEPRQICVIRRLGEIDAFSCEANPCADANLQNTCDCARPVCGDSEAVECSVIEESTMLLCDCPTCT